MTAPADDNRKKAAGAFLDIYDAHHDGVRRFLQAMTRDAWSADDLVQETFLRVLNKLDTLCEPARLRAWIYRIALNLCRDHFRSRKARHLTGQTVSEEIEILERLPAPASTEADLAGHQMNACIHRKMLLLPEGLRTVLWLYDVNGFAHAEIAQVLGISIENVKVRLHRARRKFKKILETHCTLERDERNVLVCEPVRPPAGESDPK